jgi:hypothetical protein
MSEVDDGAEFDRMCEKALELLETCQLLHQTQARALAQLGMLGVEIASLERLVKAWQDSAGRAFRESLS